MVRSASLVVAALTALAVPLAVAGPSSAATAPASGNLALNRPATGSSPCNSNETPGKAVNGSVSGGNGDKWCSSAKPLNLTVDLGSSVPLSQFVVRHAGAGGESRSFDTRDYDLQLSPDGTTFTTVAQVRGNTADVTTTTVSATGRFIRLHVITPTQSTDNHARIYEFEAYGASSPPPPPSGAMAAAPYMFHWANPPDAPAVMAATGVKWFSMAFMLSGGGCNPAWDSQRPLHGDLDERIINGIRAAGGDVIVSFGGFSGNKLGPNCPDAPSLAGAYQQVVDAYALKAVDFDVENSDEFGDATVRQRILGAIRILKQHNPTLTAILTFGTGTGGPGSLMVEAAHSIGANVDIFTIMPFDFGGSDMFADTVNASEGLRSQLMTAFGWSADTAYRHMGISSMNGMTDAGETVTQTTFSRIRDWAASHHLARLSFWAVNRDHPCPTGVHAGDTCSGIAQNDWDFTRINAAYTG